MTRRVRAPRIDFTALRRELELPEEFQLAVLREAEQAAEQVRPAGTDRPDRTDIPLVTIDPPGARDLDQAMYVEQRAGGFRVWYAIADVASFVRPGGALDTETWARGQTVYLPDGKVPLHPLVLSEGAASLLPEQVRPAALWTIDLDQGGEVTSARVERATVRSLAQLDYRTVQTAADAGTLPIALAALPAIGELRMRRCMARGGIDLPIPEQDVLPDGDGWKLLLRAQVSVERYNAQISLLTGVCAARIMLDSGVGLLRTLPAPSPEAVAQVRAAATGLDVAWPKDATVGAVVSSVDPATPRGAAFVDLAADLLRGSGYAAFDGTPPEHPVHAAVAEPYAHVTAPLRRLADRLATEVCLAVCAGRAVPEWVRAALPRLPVAMAESDRRASAAERGAIDLAEATLLAGRVGQHFDATVLDVDGSGKRGATVALDEPAVRARCHGTGLRPGMRVRVRLLEADPSRRRVMFEHAA